MLPLGGDDPERLGPYRIKAVIGDGGMGRVYLGTSPGGRAVAVKVISRGLANQPGYRERFAREARAAMAVSGLYTASVVDADTAGASPYLATEFVPAPSLAEAVGKTGPLPPPAVFALAGGMAEALVAIHRAGLVHRDVKPHNILLASDGPVVIDFGIAVGEETSLTAVGMTVGTPGYIAPEVLRGKDPSAVSDVFSLACVLVYAARGTGPYGTGDPLAIAHRTANGEPDLTGLPDKVRALVTPMLQADPARRPTPAQLLQHVSLSSSVVLHDGQWLPESVRTLLAARRLEVQQALGGGGNGAAVPVVPVGPTSPPPHQQGPTPAGTATPAGQFGQVPHGMRSPTPSTPAQDFAVLQPAGGKPTGGKPTGGKPAGSRRTFFAAVGASGAVVMAGAVVVALILAHGGGKPSPDTTHTGTGTVTNVADGGSTHATTADDKGTDASDSTSTTSTSDDAASDDVTGVAHYKPGTYKVNKQVAADLFGNTVDLVSITVDGDGTVSALLSYTAAVEGDWTCADATAGEATLDTDAQVDDPSTGNDCTKDPAKTWYMNAGDSTTSAEYFAHAPAGAGHWTFSLNSATEFQGTVSGISIPTK